MQHSSANLISPNDRFYIGEMIKLFWFVPKKNHTETDTIDYFKKTAMCLVNLIYSHLQECGHCAFHSSVICLNTCISTYSFKLTFLDF